VNRQLELELEKGRGDAGQKRKLNFRKYVQGLRRTLGQELLI
jgi:hypothetical protein